MSFSFLRKCLVNSLVCSLKSFLESWTLHLSQDLEALMQSLNVNSENIYMPLHVPIKQKNIILVVLSKKDQLKKHYCDFGYYYFFYFDCLHCFWNAFLMINDILSISRRIISKIHRSQFFVMEIRLVSCFCLYWFNMQVKALFQADLTVHNV